MATTTKSTSTKSRATQKQKAAEAPVVTEPKEEKKLTPIEIDLHQYITVRNGSRGRLVYISPRTGERFVWEEFGDSQEMELQELRNAKAANKKFFERNWFMFDDEFDWVIDYLGVRAFYKNSIGIDNFDEIFSMKPADLGKMLDGMSEGQKRSVSYRARQLLAEGEIDSMKVVETLEKSLGIDLVEK